MLRRPAIFEERVVVDQQHAQPAHIVVRRGREHRGQLHNNARATTGGGADLQRAVQRLGPLAHDGHPKMVGPAPDAGITIARTGLGIETAPLIDNDDLDHVGM
ncbi:MAG: hypothetical protein KDD83_00880 [Caldilineaceae bacterium]|nr:hypothetical protein [Caldilineaceae bacterium]